MDSDLLAALHGHISRLRLSYVLHCGEENAVKAADRCCLLSEYYFSGVDYTSFNTFTNGICGKNICYINVSVYAFISMFI